MRVRRPEGCNFLVLFAVFCMFCAFYAVIFLKQDGWVRKTKGMETPPHFWKSHAPSQI